MLKYYFIFIGLLLFKAMIVFNSLFFSFLYLITYYILWSVFFFFFNFSIYVQFLCLPIQFISNLFSCYWNFRISKLYLIRDEYRFLFFYFTFHSFSSDFSLVCLLPLLQHFLFFFSFHILIFLFLCPTLHHVLSSFFFRLLPLLLLVSMLTLSFQILLFPHPFKSKMIIAL